MADFEVRGGEQFLALSKALKHAGRTELRKELNKGLRDAAKPLIPKARAEALSRLPSSGGLARQVAREPMRVQVRTGQRTAGVRIVVGKKRGGARSTNRGFIRHPVFGNRRNWVTQEVKPGWFDDPLSASAPAIRPDIQRAMERVADRVVNNTKRGG